MSKFDKVGELAGGMVLTAASVGLWFVGISNVMTFLVALVGSAYLAFHGSALLMSALLGARGLILDLDRHLNWVEVRNDRTAARQTRTRWTHPSASLRRRGAVVRCNRDRARSRG